MESPSVYIIILNWNGLNDTLECLDSIGKLNYRKITAVVVDNGSRNYEAEAIESAFPDAIVLKQSENLGFCGGCNVGIKYAIENGADYVMLLNNDTLVTSDLIDRLLCEMVGISDAAAVSPLIRQYPSTENVWFSRARWVPSEAQFRLSFPNESCEEMSKKAPYISDFACGCCMLVKASVFQQQGYLDERYFAFYEEAEWCWRARKRGLESYVIPSATVYHKVSKSTPGLVSTYLLTRNRLLWMKENLGISERLKSYPYLLKEFLWHAANLVAKTNKYYTRPHSRAVLKGYRDYFSGKFYKWDSATEAIIFPSK